MGWIAAGLAALPTAMGLGGCLDVAIIHVEPRTNDAGDEGSSIPTEDDATVDAGPRACEACIRAPSRPGYGCGDPLTACFTNDQCKGTIECAFATGCFELSGQGAIIDCGSPCAREAGLDLNSPALQLVLDLVACGQGPCGPICRGEVDAAPPLDAPAD